MVLLINGLIVLAINHDGASGRGAGGVLCNLAPTIKFVASSTGRDYTVLNEWEHAYMTNIDSIKPNKEKVATKLAGPSRFHFNNRTDRLYCKHWTDFSSGP